MTFFFLKIFIVLLLLM